jgi:hypothetical protein
MQKRQTGAIFSSFFSSLRMHRGWRTDLTPSDSNRTALDCHLDRMFVYRDLGDLHLPENRGALLDLQPIQRLSQGSIRDRNPNAATDEYGLRFVRYS